MKIVTLRHEHFRQWRDEPLKRQEMCSMLLKAHGDCQIRSPQGRILKFVRVPTKKDATGQQERNYSPGAPPSFLKGKEHYVKPSNSCCEYLGKLEDGKHHAVCENYMDTSGPVVIELESGKVLRPAMPDEIAASKRAYEEDGVGEIKIGDKTYYVDTIEKDEEE